PSPPSCDGSLPRQIYAVRTDRFHSRLLARWPASSIDCRKMRIRQGAMKPPESKAKCFRKVAIFPRLVRREPAHPERKREVRFSLLFADVLVISKRSRVLDILNKLRCGGGGSTRRAV